MLVYKFANGKCVEYDDGKRDFTYVEVPDPDLLAWDAWGHEEAMIERRRRRKRYTSKVVNPLRSPQPAASARGRTR